ncbi:hypothetical protein SAMN05444354_101897 [Stigmatella aurantiaca]|uniref:Uncharacterized protein n=1 Tax=Stigmatella aurantiaca TaxID=41 RepID=A0A1H7I1Z2_STIAU|nr:hypothetical protein [Stigmatella aurantiaca]SEK56549.1 hypothetical protein SAMN05444354_101897 [Stigmatella aurantiaca]
MHRKKIGIPLSVLIYGLLLSGCGQPSESVQGPSDKEHPSVIPEKEPRQAQASFDVQKIMDQVHFAFRPQGTGWEGGHSTYEVRVDADGFSVTPYHYPRSQPDEVGTLRPSFAHERRREEPVAREFVKGKPVRFGAASVSRAGMVRLSHKAHGLVNATGALSLSLGEAEEHFQNGQDGVEQSWSFGQKPRGAGDLEVRLPIEHGVFVGETDKGLHFSSGNTGLGVRYGHGTWVDAQGHHTPIPARFEGGTIVLNVPAQLVNASTYPAALSPTVSPEIGMDAPVYGPADNAQYNPSLAYDGTNFLVVWYDLRRDSGADIYGTRVNSTGTVLDTAGIPISTALYYQSAPAVTFNGTNFLVVWNDDRNGSYDIYGARVSSTGTVLDSNGILISGASDWQVAPSISHDGTNFLVVWKDYRSETSSDIYGARVSNNGTILDINGIPISTAAQHQEAPSVAYNGTNFLVVWQDNRSGSSADIYGARVNSAGTVLNINGIIISNNTNAQEAPAVAYNGSDFLVVWQDKRSGTSYDIYGSRVSGTGIVRNPSGIPIFVGASDQRSPAVARGGNDCLVTWDDYRTYKIHGARVSNTGTVIDTSSIAIAPYSNGHYSSAVAYDGTNFLVVWYGYAGINTTNILGARVGSNGTVIDTSNNIISTSANGQYTPAVAHDGTNFLIVWSDRRSGYSNIYGVLANEVGEVLDHSGITISVKSSYQHNPAVAFGGTTFLVAWQDNRNGFNDIYGARVSGSGAVLETDGLPISKASSNQENPEIAYDGTNFLVVWQDYRNDTDNNEYSESDIYGARVTNSGMVIETDGMPISNAPKSQEHPAVTHNGDNFFVVWQDHRIAREDYPISDSDIYGSRVRSSDGKVIDTSGIAISTAVNYQSFPSVTHNGMNFLIVWQDGRSSSYDIYGAKVASNGTVSDTGGIAISTATNGQHIPKITYDGTNFLVVWQDYRSGTGFSDIFGARMSESGTLLDTSGFAISDDSADEREPVLTSMGAEMSLVVYRGSHVSPSTNSERVLARLVQSP